MERAVKQKQCKVCGEGFVPFLSTAVACSPVCALEHAKDKREAKARKAFNRETKRRRAALKTRSEWIADVQAEFNKFIRFRDFDQPCISCGATDATVGANLTGGSFDCGHYLSVGAHPELRFNELNAHRQCKQCNNQKSGNHANYRKGLIHKIGLPLVEWLEGPHKPLKPTIEELKYLHTYYRQRAKEARQYADSVPCETG